MLAYGGARAQGYLLFPVPFSCRYHSTDLMNELAYLLIGQIAVRHAQVHDYGVPLILKGQMKIGKLELSLNGFLYL